MIHGCTIVYRLLIVVPELGPEAGVTWYAMDAPLTHPPGKDPIQALSQK
jgi:hypothetical protein